MFRVDILNIMGPSIMAAAAIWGALRTARGRFVAFVAVTLAATLFAPFVGNASLLSSLPDPIEEPMRYVLFLVQLGLTNQGHRRRCDGGSPKVSRWACRAWAKLPRHFSLLRGGLGHAGTWVAVRASGVSRSRRSTRRRIGPADASGRRRPG